MIRERLVSILASVMFVLGIFCVINPVMGQEEHPFNGNVFDENEHFGIDGARVEFHSEEDPWLMEDVTTDNNGYYSIYLEPGNYSIIVSAEGYDTITYDRIYVGEGSYEEFYLSPQSYDGNGNGDGYDGFDDGSDGGDDGDDGSDGDDGDSENNMESFLPAGIGDNVSLLAGVCLIVFILFIVSFLIIACAALGIFVRLGKIKKDINKLTEDQSYYRYEEPYPPRPHRPRHSERDLPPPPPPPPR